VGDEVAELQTLVVSAQARSRGLGTPMLRRAEDELRARGIEEMLVASVATNDRALRFYERHGYTP
jgi:ribosomal protein S18 acetylase RimI-like enzyme